MITMADKYIVRLSLNLCRYVWLFVCRWSIAFRILMDISSLMLTCSSYYGGPTDYRLELCKKDPLWKQVKEQN